MATGQSTGTIQRVKLATLLKFPGHLGKGISSCDGTATIVAL